MASVRVDRTLFSRAVRTGAQALEGIAVPKNIAPIVHRAWKPILVLAGVVAVPYLGLYLLFTSVFCRYVTAAAAVGGNTGAEVKVLYCSSILSSSRWVEIFDYTDIVRWHADRLVSFPNNSAEASLRWTDPFHLVVTYRYCRELDDVVRQWRHVEIDYEFVPKEPPRGSVCS